MPEESTSSGSPSDGGFSSVARQNEAPDLGDTRYRLGGTPERIGGGSYGVIYRAWDRELERDVAVKLPRNRSDTQHVRRIEIEAKILGKLDHPSILPIFGACHSECAGAPLYAMKVVPSPDPAVPDARPRTLENCIDILRPDDVRGLRTLVEQVRSACLAAGAAHDSGFLHLDIKPEHVMLGHDGEVWLVDWGEALPFTDDARERIGSDPRSVPAGTRGYMSPEHNTVLSAGPDYGRTELLSERSDVYSLGRVLQDVLKRNRATKQLRAVAAKAVRDSPDDRYQSAKAMSEDLSNWLADEPVTALNEWAWGIPFEQTKRLVRKRPGILLLILLAGVIGWAVREMWRYQAIAAATGRSNIRLLQDASADRMRVGDVGTASVLLAQALVQGAATDEALERQVRLGLEPARRSLLPLAAVIETRRESRKALFRAGALSPDERVAVFGNDDGELWIVDASSDSLPDSGYEPALRLGPDKKRGDSVAAMAFSPTGSRLAAATNDGHIHVIEVREGRLLHQGFLRHSGAPKSICFTPDGAGIWVAGDRPKTTAPKDSADGEPPSRVALYSLRAIRPDRWAMPTLPVDSIEIGCDLYAVGLSADGRWLAVGGGLAPHPQLLVRRLDKPAAAPIRLPQPSRVFALGFSPARSGLLATGDVNGTVRFWDLDAPGGPCAESGPIVTDSPVRLVTFSRDGRVLLTGAEDRSARAWDVASRSPVGQRLEHVGEVRAGVVAGNSKRLLTADFAGDIRIWSFESFQSKTFRHPAPIFDAAFDEDGRHVIAAFGSENDARGSLRLGEARVWSVDDGTETLFPHGGDVMVARFRPGARGSVVTCGNDGHVRFWETTAGHSVGKPVGRVLTHAGRVIHAASFNASGDRFAFAGYGREVHICRYQPDQGFVQERSASANVNSWVWNLQFVGKALLCDGGPEPGLDDGGKELRGIVGMREGAEVRLRSADPASGLVLATDEDGGVKLWQFVDGKPQGRQLPDRPHGKGRLCAAWHGGTDIIATGGPDGKVFLRRSDGTHLAPAGLTHPAPVESLAISPDGRWLATGCRDGGTRLWLTAEGTWTGAAWHHRGPVIRLEFSRDGRRLLSASRDGTLRVVDIPSAVAGSPESVLAETEADAGIVVRIENIGPTAVFGAPRPLTAEELRHRRMQARSDGIDR